MPSGNVWSLFVMAVFREVTCQGNSQMGCTVRSLETSSQVIWGSRFQGELFSESLVSSELDIYQLTCYLWLSFPSALHLP